jgi:uncharacterized membrane-anchored protein
MQPIRMLVVVVTCFVLSGSMRAQTPGGPGVTREEFEAQLGYQTGTVRLKDMATISVPPQFRFLGPDGSRRLLTEAWGNPPAASRDVLGMLVPSDVSPLTREGWGIVITYDEHGYVRDDDAATMDFDKVLDEMREGAAAANDERRKQGFEPVTLVGWAEPPHYDRTTHKLYWAKELSFGDAADHTLNYNIRILGRRGVLVLNAVSGMNQLPAIRRETASVLNAVDFNEGHRYTDFLPGSDRAATYGLGGLIVGATAAKAGLFKGLWVGLLAFKKLIVVGFVALVGFLRRLFGGRRETTDSDVAAG